MHRNILLGIALLSSMASCGFARPDDLQEQKLSYNWSFISGVYVGFQDVLAFLGYYEDDEVSDSVASRTVIVHQEEEDHQTNIQIVGLGLGRTGTTSLVIALEMLGYGVVHDDEQVELTDLFAAESRGDIDMDEFHVILGLRGYNVTMKTANYEWVAKHPEVKAILTVRDNPDKYVNSWLAAAPFMNIIEQRPYCWMTSVVEIFPSLVSEYKMETTGGNPMDFLDPDILKKSYTEYVDSVQAAIPEERLLTFNVKQGWEPLCKFLGRPVPDDGIPFPHVHTRAKLEGEMKFLELITYIWPLAFLTPLMIVTYILKRVFDPKRHQVINHCMVLVASLLFLYLFSLETKLVWDEDSDDDE